MKKVKKIFYFITSAFMYTVLFLMILVCFTVAIYVLEFNRAMKNGNPTPPIFSSYIIASGSMTPNINVNDMVINQRVQAYEIQVGDVITFLSESPLSNGLTITHRVAAITQAPDGSYLFRTKGDANQTADEWLVPEENIIGKVLVKIPYVGYIHSFLLNSYGFLIVIVIPFLIIVIYDFIKLSRLLVKKGKNQLEKVKKNK